MARKRKRRNTTVLSRYRFKQKTHSKLGMGVVIASAVLLLFYLLFVVMAFLEDGSLSVYFGSFGVLALFGSLIAVILAVKSRMEDNVYMLWPNLALLFSLAALACWGWTYWIGMTIA